MAAACGEAPAGLAQVVADADALADDAVGAEPTLSEAALATLAGGCVGSDEPDVPVTRPRFRFHDQAVMDRLDLFGCSDHDARCAQECSVNGQCCAVELDGAILPGFVCVAARDEDCSDAEACKVDGRCGTVCGACVARSDEDCAVVGADFSIPPRNRAHLGKCIQTNEGCVAGKLCGGCTASSPDPGCYVSPTNAILLGEGVCSRCSDG